MFQQNISQNIKYLFRITSLLCNFYTINLSNLVIPLFVAIIKIGAMSLSKARLRNEKLSISSMWTSSMNKTCRTKVNQLLPSKFWYQFVKITFNTNTFLKIDLKCFFVWNYPAFYKNNDNNKIPVHHSQWDKNQKIKTTIKFLNHLTGSFQSFIHNQKS